MHSSPFVLIRQIVQPFFLVRCVISAQNFVPLWITTKPIHHFLIKEQWSMIKTWQNVPGLKTKAEKEQSESKLGRRSSSPMFPQSLLIFPPAWIKFIFLREASIFVNMVQCTHSLTDICVPYEDMQTDDSFFRRLRLRRLGCPSLTVQTAERSVPAKDSKYNQKFTTKTKLKNGVWFWHCRDIFLPKRTVFTCTTTQ